MAALGPTVGLGGAPGSLPWLQRSESPVGANLVLHGHGLRSSTVIVRAGGVSKMKEIEARRYVCRACDAVVLVVPADVARRCLYTLSVIAAALAQWSYG